MKTMTIKTTTITIRKVVMTCVGCGTEKDIVYSGVDSLILECMDLIERVCYDCANRAIMMQRYREKLNETREGVKA